MVVRAMAAPMRPVGAVPLTVTVDHWPGDVVVAPFQAYVIAWAVPPGVTSPPNSSDPLTVESLVMEAFERVPGSVEVAETQVDGCTVTAPAVAGITAMAATATSAAGAARHHEVERFICPS